MFIINKDYTLAEVDQLHRHASLLPGLVVGVEGQIVGDAVPR